MDFVKAKQQKSTLLKKETATSEWLTIDASGQVLGRLATQVATLLMGKHRPDYTPHVCSGDSVVILNAEKIKLTGQKARTKQYDYYTYYMGGRKVISFEKMMAEKPEKVVSEAVRRMLPKTKLGRQMFSRLKVYRGNEHPHTAQQPKEFKLN